jgi:anti-sigma B factor antagonist
LTIYHLEWRLTLRPFTVDADACGEGGEVGDLVCRERHGGGARVCVDACAATGAGPLGPARNNISALSGGLGWWPSPQSPVLDEGFVVDRYRANHDLSGALLWRCGARRRRRDRYGYCAAVRKAIDDVLADDPPTLVIDLAEVTLLASVGLRLLATANERFVLATAKRSVESGGFAVVAGGPETCRPIELTDLNEVFDLYLSLNDALEAVRSKHRLRQPPG